MFIGRMVIDRFLISFVNRLAAVIGVIVGQFGEYLSPSCRGTCGKSTRTYEGSKCRESRVSTNEIFFFRIMNRQMSHSRIVVRTKKQETVIKTLKQSVRLIIYHLSPSSMQRDRGIRMVTVVVNGLNESPCSTIASTYRQLCIAYHRCDRNGII